ncbi:hypothetical protein PM8797T_04195 [Gimesia maris DSM 8797]|nr:hypothetical protein PM8797T_04195 [Gimesia maris DSM 8797]
MIKTATLNLNEIWNSYKAVSGRETCS